MKSTLTRKLATVAMAGSLALLTTSVFASAGDTFDRAVLGKTWVSTAGKLSIKNNQLVGQTLSLGYWTAADTQTAASAVVYLNGTALQYGAIAIGNIGGGDNAFVKLQSQNGGGTFDHVGFYTGNNGTGNFFALTTPVASPAVMDVFFVGTVATLRITSAAGVQTFTNDYGTTYGAGGGAGTYGTISMDNFIGFVNPLAAASPIEGISASAMAPARDLTHE